MWVEPAHEEGGSVLRPTTLNAEQPGASTIQYLGTDQLVPVDHPLHVLLGVNGLSALGLDFDDLGQYVFFLGLGGISNGAR